METKQIHVIFSHGKESGPAGRKIQCLVDVATAMGLETTSVDYRGCDSAEERVALLKETIGRLGMPSEQVVLVGSSMGGYVSTVVASEKPVAGLFLMAPALWMPAEEYTVRDYQPKTSLIEITHGLNDDVVPFENSVCFARNRQGITLHLVDDGHRLGASHGFLAIHFKLFLETLLATGA